MRWSVVPVLAAVLASTACGGQRPGTGAAPEPRLTRMPRNVVGGYGVLGSLALNVEKTVRGDSVSYELFAHWTGQQRVHFRAGESLVLTADGRPLRFRAREDDVDIDMFCPEVGPCSYDERAYYPATAEQIRTIAGAGAVRVELIGAARTLQADFNELNFERYRSFVSAHVW